jgi:hypothetical protein
MLACKKRHSMKWRFLATRELRWLLLQALRHDRSVEALTQFGGDFVEFVVLVDFDCLMRRIQHYLAMLTAGGVSLKLLTEFSAELFVKIVA